VQANVVSRRAKQLCYLCLRERESLILYWVELSRIIFLIHELQTMVPGARHKSRMNKGFASIWGKNNLPHAKFHVGVSFGATGTIWKSRPD
jgi:hypothetical protein